MDHNRAYEIATAEWDEKSIEEKIECYPEDLITILLEMIDRAEKAPNLVETGRLQHFRDVTINEDKQFWLKVKSWIEYRSDYAKQWIADRAGDLEMLDDDDPDGDYERSVDK